MAKLVTATPAVFVSADGALALDALMRPTTGDRASAEVLPLVVADVGEAGNLRFTAYSCDEADGTKVLVRLEGDDGYAVGIVNHGDHACCSCCSVVSTGDLLPQPFGAAEVFEMLGLAAELEKAVAAGDVAETEEAYQVALGFAEVVLNGTVEEIVAFNTENNGWWWDWIVPRWPADEWSIMGHLEK